MGILDKLFGRNKIETENNVSYNEESYNINQWEITQKERQEQIERNAMRDRKVLDRESQLKFVFRQLACSNNYISQEDIEAQINKQGYGNMELTGLDIEVLKRFNQFYIGQNVSQEESQYLNEDTDRIVGLIEYTEKCAKEQAQKHGYKESQAFNFIEVNGKIQEYMEIEQQKLIEQQELEK